MSVAVYMTLVTPIGNADPLPGPAVCVSVTTPGQLSLAAGGAHEATALHIPGVLVRFMFTGHCVNTGGWLSVTVTVNAHTLLFPFTSLAVYAMFVTPIGNIDPLTGPCVCITETPGQLSVAVGDAHETTAEQFPGSVFMAILVGQEVNTGNWLSVTVTLNEHVAMFPLASVAVNTTLVTPIGKAEPFGKPAVCVMVNPAQLSLAAGATHEAIALHKPGLLFKTILAGHEVNTGTWLSVTVTVNEHTAVLPLASVARNETLVTPTGNAEPEARPAVCVITIPGQLSLAAGGTHDTAALHKPGVTGTAILAGHELKTGN
jgi:hypothetical protein